MPEPLSPGDVIVTSLRVQVWTDDEAQNPGVFLFAGDDELGCYSAATVADAEAFVRLFRSADRVFYSHDDDGIAFFEVERRAGTGGTSGEGG